VLCSCLGCLLWGATGGTTSGTTVSPGRMCGHLDSLKLLLGLAEFAQISGGHLFRLLDLTLVVLQLVLEFLVQLQKLLLILGRFFRLYSELFQATVVLLDLLEGLLVVALLQVKFRF
jgi:hypothetical protein